MKLRKFRDLQAALPRLARGSLWAAARRQRIFPPAAGLFSLSFSGRCAPRIPVRAVSCVPCGHPAGNRLRKRRISPSPGRRTCSGLCFLEFHFQIDQP